MTTETTRVAQIMTFDSNGRYAGQFNVRNRADWKRASREARERAGSNGTVLIAAATAARFTGRILSVAPNWDALRRPA